MAIVTMEDEHEFVRDAIFNNFERPVTYILIHDILQRQITRKWYKIR